MSQLYEFDAPFSDNLVERASRVIVLSAARRFLTRKLFAGFVLSLAAAVLAAVLFGNSPVTWFVVFAAIFIAVVVPIFLLANIHVRPRKVAGFLRQRFQPIAHIGVGADAFTVAANGRAFTLPWTDISSIVMHADFFLLVIAPRDSAVIIPIEGMPSDAQQLILEVQRAKSKAQPPAVTGA